MKNNLKKIMNRAWEIARAAAAEFGGKASEYFRGALKCAWQEAKKSTNDILARLIEIGGKLWERGEYRRVYFNYDALAEIYEFDASFYKTGNVSCATLGGSKISNKEAGFIADAFKRGKFWYDLTTNEFNWDNWIKDFRAEKLIKKIGV